MEVKIWKQFFTKFGGKGDIDADIISVIPFILYLYRLKVSNQSTIFKAETKKTSHSGYAYGISITPCFQIQLSHGSDKKGKENDKHMEN